MSTIVEFGLLGLATGGLYALFALGLVVIHRGSGVVNFAHGAVGMVGTFLFWRLTQGNTPYLLAVLVGIATSGLIGLLIHLVIMNPLRRTSLVTKIIATLGVLTVLQETVSRIYTGPPILVKSALPTQAVDILGATIGLDRVIILVGVVVFVLLAEALYRLTQFGRATSAAAENPRALAALGWSPGLIAACNWTLGSALAGLAGILLAPITNLSVTGYTLLVVPALAAAVAGRLNSIALTVAGALVIGVAQAEVSRYVSEPGWAEAVPFLAVILLLVLRGPDRSVRVSPAVRLPRLGSGRVNPWYVLPVLLGALVVTPLLPLDWQDAVTITVGSALIVLSVVLVTGYTGQLSLAQFAFAGFGAWVAGAMASHHGASFPVAVVIGVAATLPLGLVVGLVCLRTRGVNLAIATLGMAVALDSLIFTSPSRTDFGSFTVPEPTIAGFDIGAIANPGRYAILVILLFAICAIAVANVRRGRSGRRMVAVRSNERAAASLGIEVVQAKLVAFALSSAIAALGGILLAFRFPVIQYEGYNASASIKFVGFAVVGGVGWIPGALYGGLLEVGSIGSKLFDLFGPNVSSYLPLVGGALVPVMLLTAPDGLAAQGKQQLDQIVGLLKRVRRGAAQRQANPRTEPQDGEVRAVSAYAVQPRALVVKNVTVAFGGVVAVDGVSLIVNPGEIVGLIGPNGAGKTTLIDAATGSVAPRRGQVFVGDHEVTRQTTSTRARLGLSRSFQSVELFDDLTVLDNLRAASEPRDVMAYVSDLVWPRVSPLNAVTRATIAEFGLTPYLSARPADLPYGIRRLVGIARALATGASVVALDEPAAGLDDDEVLELGRLLRRLATEWQMGLLLVEHNVDLVMRLSDRIYALNFGRLIAEGTPDEIRNDARVIEAYLGAETSETAGVDVGLI